VTNIVTLQTPHLTEQLTQSLSHLIFSQYLKFNLLQNNVEFLLLLEYIVKEGQSGKLKQTHNEKRVSLIVLQ